MSKASNYLEVEIRKMLLRTGSWSKPSVLAFCLCSSDPTDAGTGAACNELANTLGYARINLAPLDANWTGASATDGASDNAVAIVFAPATGTWATITHWCCCDSATYGAGNMLFYGQLDVPKEISNTDTFQFAIGGIDIVVA